MSFVLEGRAPSRDEKRHMLAAVKAAVKVTSNLEGFLHAAMDEVLQESTAAQQVSPAASVSGLGGATAAHDSGALAGRMGEFLAVEVANGDLIAILRGWKAFWLGALRRQLTGEQVAADLAEVCGFDQQQAAGAAQVYLAREPELRARASEWLAAVADDSLVDFDWKVQVVVSSDTISSQRQPRCLLHLRTARHTRTLELDADALSQLLATLNDAKAALNAVS